MTARDTRVDLEPDTLAPPQALDAERAVLAAMMLDPGAAERAAAILRPEAFYRKAHAIVFRTLVALAAGGDGHDLVTLAEELRRRGDLEAVGGPPELARITEYATCTASIEHHARIVQDAHNRRVAQKALDRASEAVRSGESPLGETLDALRADVEPIGAGHSNNVEYLDMETPATPIEWIVPGWLARREIGVMASSAGAGKSTTVADLCIAIATGNPWCSTMQLAVNQSGPVIYFDEEQGGEEVLRLFQRLHGCRPCTDLHLASMQGIALASAEGQRRLEGEVKRILPRLVVLDTAAQVLAGVDLASLEEVSAAFRVLFRLRDLYGCTVLLLTHYRKAMKEESDLMALERVFGSVGFGGNPSTVWTAQRQDGAALEIRQVKRRGARTQKIRVSYEENEAGEITLTAESLESADAAKDRAEAFIVSAMRGQETVRTGELMAAAEAAGFPKRTAERALNQLVVVGRVEHVSRGIWALAGDTSAKQADDVAEDGGTIPQDVDIQW